MTCRRWSSSFCLIFLLLTSNFWLFIVASSLIPIETESARTTELESASSRDEKVQALIESVRPGIDTSSSSRITSPVKDVSQMCWYEVADALKLCTTPGGRFSSAFGPEALMDAIVRNLRMSCYHDVSKEEIKYLKLTGFRHQRYNRNVLEDMIKDGGRFLRYLGFTGCLELVKRILFYLSEDLNSSSVHLSTLQALSFTIGSVEMFVQHVLYTQTAPYRYIKGDPEYNFESHCEVELSYYEEIRQIVTPDKIAQIKSFHLLDIILERFYRWLPDYEIFDFYAKFSHACTHLDIGYFKAAIYPIVRDYPNVFTDLKQMRNRYKQIVNQDSTLVTYYSQMVPILRALMMIDSLNEQNTYLTTYFRVSQLNIIGKNSDGPILKVLDLMLVETKFAVFDFKTQSSHRLSVLRSILMGIDLSLIDALIAAVRRGLINLAESIMVLHSLEDRLKDKVLVNAIFSEPNMNILENLALIVAYVFDLDVKKMRTYADTIDLDGLLKTEDWKNYETVCFYNRMAALKTIILHVADVLEVLGNPLQTRSVLAQYENEVISLPCSLGMIDSLLPDLRSINALPAPFDSTPFSLVLIVMQVVLMRVFGIPLMETRFGENTNDISDWREAVAFANFMIHKYAQKYILVGDEEVPDLEMDLKLVKFVDPAFSMVMSQLRHQTSEEELAILYREACSRCRNNTPRQGASSAETTKPDGSDDYVLL